MNNTLKLITMIYCLGIFFLAVTGCQKREESAGGGAPSDLPTTTTKIGMEMVLIPAGTFAMGSEDGAKDERPVHDVSVDAFWMDRYEMTQKAYDKIARPNPAHFKGEDNPVEMVSWAAAAMFCNKRSLDEGLKPCYDEETVACDFSASGYRLPTEAEWEYACRAGSGHAWPYGDNPARLGEYAWFAGNSGERSHPVGPPQQPNRWGLFNMCGNVSEWCNDPYSADYYGASPKENPRGPAEGEKYVLRGGAWNSSKELCRSAARQSEDPGFQDACFSRDSIGFRCVRSAATESKTGQS